jgi:hypothetical protein
LKFPAEKQARILKDSEGHNGASMIGPKYFLAVLMLALSLPFSAHADDWDSAMKYFDKAHSYVRPTKKNNNGYFGWNDCWDGDFDGQPIGSPDIVGLPKICQPDTLYSWGDQRKLDMLNKEAGADKKWSNLFAREIFTHINPVATFGYGPFPIRFKLKSTTKFFLYSADELPLNDNSLCTQLSVEDQKRTVVVRDWVSEGVTGVDYIICSPNVIESWSINTKTHYDEIVAAMQWNQDQLDDDQNVNNWVPYIFSHGKATLFDTDLDHLDWSTGMLAHRMLSMRSRAAKNQGYIVYAPGVAQDESAHFHTRRPIYWNAR